MTNEMTGYRTRVPFTLVALSLVGCANSTPGEPSATLNLSAHDGYEVRARIEGQHEPFERVTAFVNYTIENKECVPMTPHEGVVKLPTKRLDVAVARQGGNLYRATIYNDALEDDDYFGRGICHWKLVAASFQFVTKSAVVDAPLFATSIRSGDHKTVFVSEKSLREAQGGLVTGTPNAGGIRQQGDVISITLNAREARK